MRFIITLLVDGMPALILLESVARALQRRLDIAAYK
jgi:hypothetical protein